MPRSWVENMFGTTQFWLKTTQHTPRELSGILDRWVDNLRKTSSGQTHIDRAILSEWARAAWLMEGDISTARTHAAQAIRIAIDWRSRAINCQKKYERLRQRYQELLHETNTRKSNKRNH